MTTFLSVTGTNLQYIKGCLCADVERLICQLQINLSTFYLHAHNKQEKQARLNSHTCLTYTIAGAGFEPATSGLWARRATRLLYPAIAQLTIPQKTLHINTAVFCKSWRQSALLCPQDTYNWANARKLHRLFCEELYENADA